MEKSELGNKRITSKSIPSFQKICSSILRRAVSSIPVQSYCKTRTRWKSVLGFMHALCDSDSSPLLLSRLSFWRPCSTRTRLEAAEKCRTLVEENEQINCSLAKQISCVIYTTMIHANVKPQYVYAAFRLKVGFNEVPNKRHRDIKQESHVNATDT